MRPSVGGVERVQSGMEKSYSPQVDAGSKPGGSGPLTGSAAVIDTEALKVNVWRKLLLWPPAVALLGMGSLIGAASVATAFIMPLSLWPLGAFVGLCAAGVAVGAAATRMILGTERITKATVAQMQAKAVAKRERALDALDQALRGDGDARTEGCLRALRTLYGQFLAELGNEQPSARVLEIASQCERLFRGCVLTLRRTLELYEAAGRMNTRGMQQRMLESRERMIVEVELSIEHLSRIIDGVHAMNVAGNDESQLQRIRGELDASLEVATNVEQRMRTLERDLGDVGRRSGEGLQRE